MEKYEKSVTPLIWRFFCDVVLFDFLCSVSFCYFPKFLLFSFFVQMLLLQGNNYGGGGSSNSYGQPSSTAGHMYEDDLISRGARAFPLGHGMVPTPQAFSFGFPVHPAHDPMGLSSCKCYSFTFTTLWAISTDDKFTIFFLFLPENRL